MSERPKRVGILNKGKNNTFIDNEFHGFDVGIQDEGEGTHASGNRFHDFSSNLKLAEWHTTWWGVLVLTVAGGIVVGLTLYFSGTN